MRHSGDTEILSYLVSLFIHARDPYGINVDAVCLKFLTVSPDWQFSWFLDSHELAISFKCYQVSYFPIWSPRLVARLPHNLEFTVIPFP